jgi:short-subunit dehydrogenase
MLLSEGVRVWGTSRDTARLSDLASRHGPAFTPVALDLSAGAEAEAALGRAGAEAGGGFDLLVNNAGYGIYGEFAAVDAGAWIGQLDAMLGTSLRLAHAAYRGMRARGRGCLVNVSSLAAEFPLPYFSGYNVAKAGLSALSESLIFESRGTAVKVIDFRPGDYRTAFNQAMQFPVGNAATARVWRKLDADFRGAPEPARAAADLRRALLENRSGIVRSGSAFQARIAPFLVRLIPESWRRVALARYFGAA